MSIEQICAGFERKNVLITGGPGRIGREIAELLANHGAHVRVVSLDRINLNENIDHVYGDLTDFNFCL